MLDTKDEKESDTSSIELPETTVPEETANPQSEDDTSSAGALEPNLTTSGNLSRAETHQELNPAARESNSSLVAHVEPCGDPKALRRMKQTLEASIMLKLFWLFALDSLFRGITYNISNTILQIVVVCWTTLALVVGTAMKFSDLKSDKEYFVQHTKHLVRLQADRSQREDQTDSAQTPLGSINSTTSHRSSAVAGEDFQSPARADTEADIGVVRRSTFR
jgi:hypothetical protein